MEDCIMEEKIGGYIQPQPSTLPPLIDDDAEYISILIPAITSANKVHQTNVEKKMKNNFTNTISRNDFDEILSRISLDKKIEETMPSFFTWMCNEDDNIKVASQSTLLKDSTLIPITSDNKVHQTFPPATQPNVINLWNDDDDDAEEYEHMSNDDILPDILLESNGFSHVRFNKILNKYLTNEKNNKLKFNFLKIMKIIGTNKINSCVFQHVICFLSLFGISMYYFYNIFNILCIEYTNLYYTKDDVDFLKVFRKKTLQAFEYMFKSQTNINTQIYNSSLKEQESYRELCDRLLFLQVRCQYILNKYADILSTMTKLKYIEEYNGLNLFLKLECDVFNLDIWNPDKLILSL